MIEKLYHRIGTKIVFVFFLCSINNMSMPGLPPLPKSLSGFELAAAQQQLQYGLTAITEQAAAAAAAQAHQGSNHNQHVLQSNAEGMSQQSQNVAAMQRRPSTLDTQLSILRREMVREVCFNNSRGYERRGLFCHHEGSYNSVPTIN